MFTDDSSLSASGNNIAAINAKLQPSIQEVTEWCSANAILLNPEKTKSMVVATRQKHHRGIPPLRLMLNSRVIEQVSEHRHLGVILNDQLKWQAHINRITNAVAKNVYLLSRLRHFCNSEACNTFFHALIMSRINYVFSCSDVHLRKLKAVHKLAVKVLCAASPMLSGRGHISYGPLPLKEHLQCNKCILVHKVIHNKSPQYSRQLVQIGARSDHSSWNSILILPKTRIDIYKMSFAYSGSFCWNALPRSLKTACSVSTFKSKALKHFRTERNT